MIEFNPEDYDAYHIGVSGGKDSTAALLWLVNESGWDKSKIVATFCETDNEDFLTYKYLDMLHQVHPIEIIWPIRCNNHYFDKLGFYDLAKFKKRFPSRRARFCTQWLKVVPSREFVLFLQKQDKKVLLINGVRKEEAHSGNDRGELKQFDWAEDYACDIYRPVYEWSMSDIWQIHKKYLDINKVLFLVQNDPLMSKENKIKLIDRMKKHGIPRNPLYDMGASRVGCFPCINSRKAEIRAMNEYRPGRIDYLRQKEIEVGEHRRDGISTFFARNTVPLNHRTKSITTTKGEQMKVCTIDDVVNWSKTAYGGKQYDIDLYFENEDLTCSIGGYCE